MACVCIKESEGIFMELPPNEAHCIFFILSLHRRKRFLILDAAIQAIKG
jgi:hypothetical protein